MSIHEPTYGSDRVGLVWAYRFRSGERGHPIGSEELQATLAAENVVLDEFYWLHFNLANTAAQPWVREHLSLAEAFHESLHHSQASPGSPTRVELAGESVVAVLNDVQFFALEPSEASTVNLCADRHMLVSARRTPLRSIDRLREAVRAGETFRSPAELVAHLLRDQADVLVEIVREATVRVDEIEDQLFTGRTGPSRARLGLLRRRLVRLQRLLAPEPAALFRLLNRPPAWIGSDDAQDLRQSAEELSAAVADSIALVERVKLLQEELMAFVNEATGRTLFVLTVVTVLALPMTIIPGLFGMNVGGLPFRDRGGGFWMVAAMSVLVPAIGAWWVFGRRRDP